ncbi:MAG: hypothetical protein ACI91Q_000545 [Gammaproteobacteria bacterium]|jgi:hypothetical protein
MAALSAGPYRVQHPWLHPDPVGQRFVLTVLVCALVIGLPFGPYRVRLAP